MERSQRQGSFAFPLPRALLNVRRICVPRSWWPQRRARGTTHGDRFTAQLRIVALLDGSVERIHVDMNNLT